MITNKLGAYFNDPAIKAKYVGRYKAHMIADEVIQGNMQRCFIGCTLDNYDHIQFENELNLPEWLGHLTEVYFENAPAKLAAQYGLDVLEAIQCGQNVEPVRWELAVWRHTKQLFALAGNDADYAVQCRAAIQQVIDYCQSQITEPIAESAESAESDARSAARSAARPAESAAWSAARSAESAARSAARSAAWKGERDMFLQLLREGAMNQNSKGSN